jgi:cytoskeletal protein CcmA (bactofilin family)
MADEETSILLNDVSIEGDLIEKEKIIIDAKIVGDIKAQEIITHQNSNIKGNINSKDTVLGGKVSGVIDSDTTKIKKTGNIDGVLNQKTLSIEEGATLKIKTETHK